MEREHNHSNLKNSKTHTLISVLVLSFIFFLAEDIGGVLTSSLALSIGMLAVASIGLAVSLVSMWLLTAHKDKSICMKDAYLEVLSDMLGSIGIIIGAIIIKYTGFKWIDSIIAIMIALWVLPRTWLLLNESMKILLEGVPKGIDLNKVETSLLEIKGVINIHELHLGYC